MILEKFPPAPEEGLQETLGVWGAICITFVDSFVFWNFETFVIFVPLLNIYLGAIFGCFKLRADGQLPVFIS